MIGLPSNYSHISAQVQLSGKQQPFAHTDGLSSADSAALLVFLSALGPKNVFLKQPDHLTFDAGW